MKRRRRMTRSWLVTALVGGSVTRVDGWSRPTIDAGHHRVLEWAAAAATRSDYFDDDDDDAYWDTRPVGGSREAEELRSMPLQDYYDDDDDDDIAWMARSSSPPVDRWFLDDDNDDEPTGNFWYNPPAQWDRDRPTIGRRPRRPSRGEERPLSSTAPPHQRPGRKTTFRSGTPPPPAPVRDLYDRLFWYGFDPAETASPADPTMFGGTKGKFNGLAYLNDESISSWAQERRPRPERTNESERPPLRRPAVTPPYDPPQPRPSPPTQVEWPRQRRQEDDAVATKVASWFSDDDDDNAETISRRRPRRDTAWSPWKVLDVFLGVDKDGLAQQAQEYDRQIGRDRPARSSRRRRGSAYPYDAKEHADDDDNEPEIVVDVELAAEEDAAETVVPDHSGDAIDDQARRVDLSWEERALAVERVPPAGIAAWGPSGDLGIDARTKAILDAVQDIQEARQSVKDKERKVEQAREDISILRVDAELEKKRLRKVLQDSKTIQVKLRRLDAKVQDASRALRYAQSRLKLAKELLADIESRHWAVMSFYNPNQVEESVKDALRELEDSEPAVRRYKEKIDNVDSADKIQNDSTDDNVHTTD